MAEANIAAEGPAVVNNVAAEEAIEVRVAVDPEEPEGVVNSNNSSSPKTNHKTGTLTGPQRTVAHSIGVGAAEPGIAREKVHALGPIIPVETHNSETFPPLTVLTRYLC